MRYNEIIEDNDNDPLIGGDDVEITSDDLSRHDKAIDLIHRIVMKLHTHYHNVEILDLVVQLAKTIDTLSFENKENDAETFKRVLQSIAKQMNPDTASIKTNDNTKQTLLILLKKLYKDLIMNDPSFDKLATTNAEAKLKINKIAKMIFLKSDDQDVKDYSSLVMKQANQIRI